VGFGLAALALGQQRPAHRHHRGVLRRPGHRRDRAQRLLYAAADDDGRQGRSWGGLWITRDGAASWSHVDLPGCSGPGVNRLEFKAGRAVVAAGCGGAGGLFTSTDLQTWDASTITRPPGAAVISRVVAADGQVLFACDGSNQVWRSPSLGSANSWAQRSLPGSCRELAVVPGNPRQVLAIYATTETTTDSQGTKSRTAYDVIVRDSGLTVNGSTLTVSWVVAFQQSLAHRTLAEFLSAEDLRRARTGFVRAGSFTVR
jgi:hypothetical protein